MDVPRAQLRVFSPLEAFPRRAREHWRRYVATGGGLTRREAQAAETGAARRRLLTGRGTPGPDTALVRRAGARVLVCPLQLELRAAIALEELRRSVPDAVYGTFLPEVALRPPRPEPDQVAHILDAPWIVPLHWFVAFSPNERHLTDPPEGAGPRLRYLTDVQAASARLARVAEIVEEQAEDGEDILALLADLAVWLDEFDASSVLELDYGGIAGLLSPQELRDDTTCADLWEAVHALEAGDGLAVAAAYSIATRRWWRLRATQRAS